LNGSGLKQLVRDIAKGESISGSWPLTELEFRDLMAAVGPFEDNPTIAVAVSGGPDSLCLALLLKTWLRYRGGEVVALIVDHQLRPESASEAKLVQGWLKNHGIRSHVLVWRNQTERGKQQAKARAGRYNLLFGWCRAAQVLHLAVGHHRDDQAETVLFRKERSSGNDGLAGIPAVREQDSVRLIRPFLAIPSLRLRTTLQEYGQHWISDPSNRNPEYARTRIRKYLQNSSSTDQGIELAKSGACFAKIRAEDERKTSELLARSTMVYSEGFCVVNVRPLISKSLDLSLRAVSQIVVSVGGKDYAPRQRSLRRLLGLLRRGELPSGYTMGGCLLRFKSSSLVVCREPIAAGERFIIKADEKKLWDGRFIMEFLGEREGALAEYEVRALSEDGWQIYRNSDAYKQDLDVPFYAAYTLPSFWSIDGLVAVPHLQYIGPAFYELGAGCFRAGYKPKRPLAGPVFQGI
jgi:tRNA(Ile)-lysidine synthase